LVRTAAVLINDVSSSIETYILSLFRFRVIRFLNDVLFGWWEHILFDLWKKIPIAWRRSITYTAWKIYLPLHKLLLGRRTGIHPDASEEYHALTTIMWWGRLFPVTVRRMRFSLSQLTAWQPQPVLSSVEEIKEPQNVPVPDIQKEHCTVQGLLAHTKECPTEYIIFWLYGGAFLSGDAQGNLGPAEWVGRQCEMDVFIPSYRLVPEAEFHDLLWDVCLAYRWLCQRHDPSKIILFGISSGAALVTRIMQFIAEEARGEEIVPNYVKPLLCPMPAGAVLVGPFVDFTEPKGSFEAYQKHDLIVNERVMEEGLPYFETHMSGDRKESSPVHRSMEGLPPLCVVVSEHEVVYDQTIELVNQARTQGVQVTLGVWKYMCHVFTFLSGFVPEGEQSLIFLCDWIRKQGGVVKDE